MAVKILSVLIIGFQITNLNFLPIEPPRTGNPSEETYARRQHQFINSPNVSRTRSLFQKMSSSSLRDATGSSPRVSADLRLPNPSILTCNEPVPMRVLVKKLSESYETIFLQMIQVELIAYTNILAHDLRRTESGTWVLLSRSNMSIPLGRGGDPADTEYTIDADMWNRVPLPSTVAPSFETCNVSRTYELEVRVGLTHGSVGNMKVGCHLYILGLDALLTAPASTYHSSVTDACESLLRHRSSESTLGCHGSQRAGQTDNCYFRSQRSDG